MIQLSCGQYLTKWCWYVKNGIDEDQNDDDDDDNDDNDDDDDTVGDDDDDDDENECVRMCGGLAAERSRIPGTLLIPHNYTFQDHYFSYILHLIHSTL